MAVSAVHYWASVVSHTCYCWRAWDVLDLLFYPVSVLTSRLFSACSVTAAYDYD